MRYFIEIAYNGKNYYGWQIQPHCTSVQKTIEEAITTVLRTKTEITGAGRTDAGVHAKQTFAHFDFETPINVPQFLYKLNAFLPKDILLKNAFRVHPNAHARFDAIRRTYQYILVVGKEPFLNEFSYSIPQKPDIEKMNAAAQILLEETDFQCFSKTKTDVKTFHCKVFEAFWEEETEK